MLWSAGLDYLTKDNQFGFDDPRAADGARQAARACSRSKVAAARRAHRLVRPVRDHRQGLTAMQLTGLWTFPDLKKGLGDDFGVMPWPALDGSSGKPSVPVGAYGSCVSAKSQNVDAAKAFVKWLWVDQTDDQLDFAQSLRLPHPGPQEPRGQGATSSRAGRPPTRPSSSTRTATRRRRCCGRPSARTAFSDALTRIVKERRRPGQARSPRSRPSPTPS